MSNILETFTVIRVPTGIQVPPAMYSAQERLLSRFNPEDPPGANNIQAAVDNGNTALIFALLEVSPKSIEDWQTMPTERYIGTLTMLLLKLTTRDVAHIDHVVVDYRYERQGIGARLVRKAIDIGHVNGAVRFDLTSNASKESAQALYEKVGFHRRKTVNWRYDK